MSQGVWRRQTRLEELGLVDPLPVALPTSIQRLGRMRSGAVVEEIGDRPPSVRENQRSSSMVENILEISSEVTRAPSLEEEGVSRRRTTVVAEL